MTTVGLLQSFMRWRFGVGWYLLAILGPIVLTIAAFQLNMLLGGPPPTPVWQAPPSQPPSLPFAALAIFTIAASVVLRWLYTTTGSALPAVLLLAATGTAHALFRFPPGDSRPFELYAGLLALVAIALVVSQRRHE